MIFMMTTVLYVDSITFYASVCSYLPSASVVPASSGSSHTVSTQGSKE